MKKVMLLGAAGAGKTTLLHVLRQDGRQTEKTLTIEFYDGGIDTPGEYSQIPRFYSSLMVTAMEASVILILQDASNAMLSLPPGFRGMFNKPVAGVVTKVDRADADRERACRYLRQAGVKKPVFFVSVVTGEGLEELIEYLEEGRESNEQ
ncbi:hypothetical protein P22_0401 [Propionispora sp. 2/2-37]|uniref:EutP/PduV family microcompartment system protein n=1 Tax=Propionispora sp. 2/2-37 TaxID=1677858 RepID=UPI0006BB82A5|nr:EutP/PduV family microcompartment system protein [Propionispora sp. 2/2-37]CUH94335.1 hypothetical protein P22_0401 [Propionispora sp. 2/2-37]